MANAIPGLARSVWRTKHVNKMSNAAGMGQHISTVARAGGGQGQEEDDFHKAELHYLEKKAGFA